MSSRIISNSYHYNMNSHKEVNIPKSEQTLLKISNIVKEVMVFIHSNGNSLR